MSASPVRSPGTERDLFVLWPDAEQLVVLDAGEGVHLTTGAFDRAWLPAADVPAEPALGPVPPGVYAYVNRRGVLRDGTTDAPRTHPGEHPLLTELLSASPRLRELFGQTPEEFRERARGNRELCLRGTELLAKEGLVIPSGLEPYAGAPGPYDTSA